MCAQQNPPMRHIGTHIRNALCCTSLLSLLACATSTAPEADLSQPGFEETLRARAATDSQSANRFQVDVNIVGNARDMSEVESALAGVASIYSQCDIQLDTELHSLPDEGANAVSLTSLYGLVHDHMRQRPTVFIIDSTEERDVAFSYLPSLARDVSGTAWISKRVSEQCLAWIVTHELGHIVLDSSLHHSDPRNVMSTHCTSYNATRITREPEWSDSQCDALREGISALNQ